MEDKKEARAEGRRQFQKEVAITERSALTLQVVMCRCMTSVAFTSQLADSNRASIESSQRTRDKNESMNDFGGVF